MNLILDLSEIPASYSEPSEIKTSFLIHSSPVYSQVTEMDDFTDLSNVREDQFDQMAVYFVPDQPLEAGSQLSRAEQTLPRNLAIKPSQTKTSVSRTILLFHHFYRLRLACSARFSMHFCTSTIFARDPVAACQFIRRISRNYLH